MVLVGGRMHVLAEKKVTQQKLHANNSTPTLHHSNNSIQDEIQFLDFRSQFLFYLI
jgi:hypothetical protein